MRLTNMPGVITSSGMSAVDLPLNLVGPGELVLAPHDCYGGTFRLLSAHARKGNFRVKFVNQTDPAAFAAALAEKPKLVFIETPSNPLLRITDIAAIASASKAAGAIVVADNTFLSPVLQQPLLLGPGDACRRRSTAGVTARSNFHEHQCGAVAHYQVDLAARAAEIARDGHESGRQQHTERSILG